MTSCPDNRAVNTGPMPTSHAVAAFIKVGWDEANEPHLLSLRLLDSDGQTVSVPGPAGEQPINFPGNLEMPRPAGIPHGSEIDATLAVNAGALPLVPGQRYRWQLEIDGQPIASEPFLVRPMPTPPEAPRQP